MYFGVHIALYAVYQQRLTYFKHIYDGTLDLGSKYSSHVFIQASLNAATIFLGAIVWTFISDKIQKPKILLILTLTCACFSFYSFIWVKTITQWYIVTIMYSFFAAAFSPILDSSTLTILMSHPNGSKELYGRQKLWAPIAYAVSSATAGALASNFSFSSLGFWSISAHVFAILIIIPAFPNNVPQMKKNLDTQKILKKEEVAKSSNTFEIVELEDKSTVGCLKKFLLNPGFLFFLLTIMLVGMSRSIMTNYLSDYLITRKIASAETIGHSAWVSSVMEVLVFVFAKTFLHYLGPYMMLVLAQFFMLIRVFSYLVLPRDITYQYFIHVIEVCKGLNAAMVHITGVQLASVFAPLGYEQTAQGLYSGVYNGLSAVFGASIGGAIMNHHSAKTMFFCTTIFTASSVILMIVKFGAIDKTLFRKREKPSQSV
jgi:predicted MFS family arabinose efflux permease